MGLLSFLTNTERVCITIKAIPNDNIAAKYSFTNGKVSCDAPKNNESCSKKIIPNTDNIVPDINDDITENVKILFAESNLPFPIEIESAVAPPTPNINPILLNILYIGIPTFSAAKPKFPIPLPINIVSKNIHIDNPSIPRTLGIIYLTAKDPILSSNKLIFFICTFLTIFCNQFS